MVVCKGPETGKFAGLARRAASICQPIGGHGTEKGIPYGKRPENRCYSNLKRSTNSAVSAQPQVKRRANVVLTIINDASVASNQGFWGYNWLQRSLFDPYRWILTVRDSHDGAPMPLGHQAIAMKRC